MKIAIDLGHGVGQDRGATGIISEETIINNVGRLVISKLKALGHTVIETRPVTASCVTDALEQRTNKANFSNVDLFASIHANAGGGIGTEVFTFKGKELEQARAVLNNLVNLGFRNRGLKGNSLYVTGHAKAPAMLIEICFIDTPSDIDLYNSIGVENIADAIVKGLVGQTITNKKGYIVTNYLPNGYRGNNEFEGVDLEYVLSYFDGVRCYAKSNSKGIWIETEYLDISKCNELKETLGSWFYEIRY
ncbi:N-acetylmuramoyl-L-alanine amidase [Clostridium botulinum]|uniref:N-acetylmuramoyl-L-alanine amidase n=1 Tax=Clostridium botulinum TaxID=1491 RepID=UPI001967B297|nr:N-acetylmuramoyl-L-alanine amidase [Clostridium botulinum]MBN1050309.1 N-acetylmuramoyl-L-alanine amidase [Clostridium botulinum]